MEPVFFTMLVLLLMVGAIAWVVFHLVVLILKVVFWIIKTPFRVGRHIMFNASARPMLSLRCANRRCGARLREEGRFCPRCGQAASTHQLQLQRPQLPVSRIA